MDHFPLNWGKPRVDDEAYNPYPSHGPFTGRKSNYVASVPKSFTQQPIVTGTSVIAIKYKDGIVMATDCLASYGSLARFRDLQRVKKVGDLTLLGASGDISDFQHVSHILDQLMTEERIVDDGHVLNAVQVYEYMSNVMYNRRSKMNPLWNAFVVAGVAKGDRFLGYVDLLGTTYQSPSIATGFGAHLAQPLLRKALEGGREDTLTEDEAKNIVKDCMRVLYYRDARSLNKFHLAKADARGVTIEGPMSVETEWGFAKDISGYGA